jgi:hypothetical protein
MTTTTTYSAADVTDLVASKLDADAYFAHRFIPNAARYCASALLPQHPGCTVPLPLRFTKVTANRWWPIKGSVVLHRADGARFSITMVNLDIRIRVVRRPETAGGAR